MKAAVLSESPADEAAVRILVDAILGQKTTPAHLPPLRSRGWPSVLDNLAAIIKHLHYRTDAEALVVVVDTNGSPLQGEPDSEHTSAKDSPRLFRLAEQVQTVQRSLKPVPGKEPLRISLGVAAPSVEAWYQCGIDPTATEAAWMRDLDAGAQAPARIRSLKRAVYGHPNHFHPSTWRQHEPPSKPTAWLMTSRRLSGTSPTVLAPWQSRCGPGLAAECLSRGRRQ